MKISNENVVNFPRRVDQRLLDIADAADIVIMHSEGAIFEIAFPETAMDAEAIVEIAQALSRLKVRQHQSIEILAADFMGGKPSDTAH